MKFLSVVFFIFIAFISKAEIGPVDRSSNLDYSGAVSYAEKRYINVKNVSGSSIATGKVVALDLSADDGVSVLLSATAGHAPICIMSVTCASNALCKCQTYGKADAAFNATGANATAGQRWYMSTSAAGSISGRNTPSYTNDVPGGVFLDDATSTGVVEVFIKP